MVALLIALLGAGYALAVGLRGRVALGELSPDGVGEVVRAARRAERAEDLTNVARGPALGSGVREIVARLLRAGSPAEARAAIDEYLAELDAALSAASAPLAPHARVSMTSGTLAAILALLAELPDVARAVPLALGSLGVGLAGAAAVTGLGRSAAARARRYRSDYDRLVSALARWV